MFNDFDHTVWGLFASTGQIGYYMLFTDLNRQMEREELEEMKR